MLFDTAFVESSNFRDILYYVNYQCFNHHFFSIIVCLNNNRKTELNRSCSVHGKGAFWRVGGTTPTEGYSTLHLFPITNVDDFLGSQHASTAVIAGSDAAIGRNIIRFGFEVGISLDLALNTTFVCCKAGRNTSQHPVVEIFFVHPCQVWDLILS